jgi:hypothetical protein
MVPPLFRLGRYRDRFELKVMHEFAQDQERGGKLRIGWNRVLCRWPPCRDGNEPVEAALDKVASEYELAAWTGTGTGKLCNPPDQRVRTA